MKHIRLSVVEVTAVQKMRSSGQSVEEIARKLGLPEALVRIKSGSPLRSYSRGHSE